MSVTKQENGSYVLNARTPGYEAAAFGTGLAPDLNADGSFGGLEGGVEVTTGGLLSYSIYTAVMTTLETVPARRAGLITAREQREIVLDKTWAVTKGAVPTVVIIGAVLAICPWLAPVAGLAGFIGGSVMTVRLVRAGWDAMSDSQREAIQQKAQEVGVDMPDNLTTQPAGA